MPAALIPPPEYEPTPYSFSGLAYDKLPLLAQHYLAEQVKITSPSTITPDAFGAKRLELAQILTRSLHGWHLEIVNRKEEAARRYAEFKASGKKLSPEEEARVVQGEAQRALEVVLVLLPQRDMMINEFMTKWDAMFWLEMESRMGGMEDKDRPTIMQQQEERLRSVMPILAQITQEILNVDRTVMEMSKSKARPARPQIPGADFDTPNSPIATRKNSNTLKSPMSAQSPLKSARDWNFPAACRGSATQSADWRQRVGSAEMA